jgi:hypothetical protein
VQIWLASSLGHKAETSGETARYGVANRNCRGSLTCPGRAPDVERGMIIFARRDRPRRPSVVGKAGERWSAVRERLEASSARTALIGIALSVRYSLAQM